MEKTFNSANVFQAHKNIFTFPCEDGMYKLRITVVVSGQKPIVREYLTTVNDGIPLQSIENVPYIILDIHEQWDENCDLCLNFEQWTDKGFDVCFRRISRPFPDKATISMKCDWIPLVEKM